jgi:ATP-dependent RNA helicase SUPV3L1/SUV3
MRFCVRLWTHTHNPSSCLGPMSDHDRLSQSIKVFTHCICCFSSSRYLVNETDIFPYFLQHAHKMFPHLNCLEELKHLSNLSEPANWYPGARQIKRKIIYHAGPTNSGKTYSALKSFTTSASGIYCGPLKLLANEVC